MENYIINPQVFYWINVIGILQTIFAVIGTFSAIGFVALLIAWIYNAIEVKKDYKSNEPYRKVCKIWAIITGIIAFVMITAAIFLPGKTTSIEMLIAKTVTYDNVNWTVQQVKDIVDYIINAIKSI